MSGTITLGGKTLASHSNDTDKTTLTADEANVGSNALVVDSSGNVGIGTTPTEKLSVNGGIIVDTNVYNKLQLLDTVNSDVSFVVSSGSSATTIGNDVNSVTGSEFIQLRATNDLRFGTSGTARMLIDSSGNIGAPSGTNIYNASDERLKQNITDLSGCLQKVLSMRGVSFNWINEFCDSEADKTLYGLIAQELQIVDSNLVDSFSDNTITAGSVTVENPLRVNEKFIIPMLVESIKEQQALIESQQSQIDALTARIEALEAGN